MKNWKKFLIVSLSFLFVVTSVLAGLVNFVKVDNTSNNSGNKESNVVTPSSPDNYNGMVYYASEGEETGASEAPEAVKGGAIYVSKGSTFKMEGGTIANFESQFGGAVYIANGGTFEMTGGTIEYNYSEFGGAIFIEDGGRCIITGGSIINNKSENAPAIFVDEGAELTISDNVIIDDNYETTYGDVIINYFVDGEISKSVVQYAPTLNFNHMPLTYDNCCGYFFDEDMTINVERGDDLALLKKNENLQSFTSNKEGVSLNFYNLYTRTATLDKLTFNGNSVKSKDTSISGEVVIPRTHSGTDIKEIGDSAFYNCQSITEVIMPFGITSIGSYSFKYCSQLNDIQISNSVQHLGSNAFFNCISLESVELPNDMIYLDMEVFYNCENLKNINLDNIQSIQARCFYNCKSLTTVTIPEKMSYIGQQCFVGCDNITQVNYNATKVSYARLAFSISSDNGTSIQLNIGSNVQLVPGELFSSSENLRIVNFEDNSSCTVIGAQAFRNAKNLSTINIPNSVNKLSSSAFYGASSLTTIYLPDSITSIDASVFQLCNNLKYINIPKSITTINNWTFDGCTSLESIEIHENITSIGNYAFQNCSSLKEVKFHNTVTLGTKVFNNDAINSVIIDNGLNGNITSSFLSALGTSVKELELGAGVTSVTSSMSCYPYLERLDLYNSFKFPEDAFLDNENLQYINIRDLNSWVMLEYESLYTWPLWNSAKLLINNVEIGTNSDGRIVLDESVNKIGNFAFCSINTIKSVESTSPITSIGNSAFKNCIELINIFNFANVLNIGAYAFENCIELVNILNFENVTTINSCAFYNCKKITSITIPESTITLGSRAFAECDNLNEINLKALSLNTAYQAFIKSTELSVDITLNIDSTVTQIPNSTFYELKNLKTVNFNDNSQCKVIGDSCFSGATNLTIINIPNSITKIGEFAFYNCNLSITTLHLENVTEIGQYAFNNSKSLESINLEKVTVIGQRCFYNCENLENIELKNIITIGDHCFYNCKKITSITIPESTTTLGNYAFYGCDNLNEINLKSSNLGFAHYAFEKTTELSVDVTLNIASTVTQIPSYTFYKLTNLKTVNFEENSQCRIISHAAFYGATNLTSISLPDSITEIATSSFQICTNLKSINFPSSIKLINDWTFDGCTSLESIEIHENITSIGDYAFQNCTSLKEVKFNKIITLGTNSFNKVNSIESVTIENGIDGVVSGSFLSTFTTSVKALKLGAGVTSVTSSMSCYPNLERLDLYNSFKFPEDAFYYNENLKYVNIRDLNSWVMLEYETIYTWPLWNYAKLLVDNIEIGTNNDGKIILDESVNKIGNYAFYLMTAIKSVEASTPITSIGEYAFYNCFYIEDVFDLNNVTSIGEHAFYNCRYLSEAIDLENVTDIGEYAFNCCENLLGIILGNNITSINDEVFSDCGKLNNIVIPNSVTSISSSAFDETSAEDLSISVSSITESFMFDLSAKLKVLRIGAGVTSIGINSFRYCSSLEQIIIDASNISNLTSTSNAFYDAGSENGFEVIFSESVTNIPEYLFYVSDSTYSPNITSVRIESEAISFGNYAFYGLKNLQNIFYNTNATAKSKTSNVFYNSGAESGCELVIGENVNNIPMWMFYQSNISSIDFNNAKSLTRINRSAFEECTKLKELIFNRKINDTYDMSNGAQILTVIADYAFKGCTSLQTLSFQIENLTTVAFETFRGCTNLSSIEWGTSIQSINGYCFADCTSLPSKLTLPEGVEKIYTGAFNDSSVNHIVLPSTAKRIGKNCFNTCSNVEFAGDSINHIWQLQDGEGNVVNYEIDIKNSESNAVSMSNEYKEYYYIRDDYGIYVQPES